MVVQPLFYEEVAEHGGEHDGDEEGHRQRDRDRDRERHDELAGRAGQDQERQEGGDDRYGRSKHRHQDVRGASPGRLALRDLPVQKFDVVVGYDDGVVNHDSEDHDERGDGDLMQGYPHHIHDSEGAAQRYRYGKSRDERDPQGKEYDGDQNDRNNSQQELVTQMRNPLLDDLRLVGDRGRVERRGEGAP